MIAALAGRNLRHLRRLLLASAAGLAAFEVILSWAAAQMEMGSGLQAMLRLLPQAFQSAFASQMAFVSFPGAVAFGFDHPIALAISLGLVVASATIPAAERETGFLDLVLARAVPRRKYFLASLATVAIVSFLAPASLLAGAALGLTIVDLPSEIPWTRYVPCALGLSALLLAAGGLSLLVASGARRRGPAIARSIALLAAFFFLDFLSQILPRMRWLGYATPFHYFRPVASAVIPETPLVNPAALLALFAAATALAFVRFEKSDL